MSVIGLARAFGSATLRAFVRIAVTPPIRSDRWMVVSRLGRIDQQFHRVGAIQIRRLGAVHDRPALDGHAAACLLHPRVSDDLARLDREAHLDDVAVLPDPIDRDVPEPVGHRGDTACR